MLERIKRGVDAAVPLMRGFRRMLHQHPELSGEERNTAALVAGHLQRCGIETRTGVGGHGVVGVLLGGLPGPTIALRADMDALPMEDRKQVEYASKVKGAAHACGHDAHTAILMAAALVLSGLRDGLKGNVKFIFQPSEEKSTGGAKAMIEDGALDDPRPGAIAALHCYPSLEAGCMAHKAGIMTAASDNFTVAVKGRAGHGARPHEAIDAILISAHAINAIHQIVSRRVDPLERAVVSIGTINGGTAPNIIAEQVLMQGTVRTLSAETRARMPGLMEEVLKGITSAMGGSYELVYESGTPSVKNDAGVDALVMEAARDIVGTDGVVEIPEPLMGSEDFSYFTERVPGALFRLGTGNRAKGITSPLHSSTFDIDEDALPVGAKLMCWIAARYLLQSP